MHIFELEFILEKLPCNVSSSSCIFPLNSTEESFVQVLPLVSSQICDVFLDFVLTHVMFFL